MSVAKFKKDEKALIRRYLVWCYKSTKESLDRINRKFTQAAVDHFILDRLKHSKATHFVPKGYNKLLESFALYISDKEKEGVKQKFFSGTSDVHPDYLYLKNRLKAVEDAISHFLGSQELTRINIMYEEEMTRRILESKEH